MPEMKGFELLNEVRRRWPSIKRVLITAYNVEDYIDLALKHDMGNIFVKTTPFNFDELSAILKSLLNEDIFGIERYFPDNGNKQTFRITRGDSLDDYVKQITTFLPPVAKLSKLNLVLVELLTNAVFYGIRGEDPEHKELWNYDFELPDNDAIVAQVAFDEDKYAISIVDQGGRLKKDDVLFWLHRQISQSTDGLPLGINDNHGRGLFIARRYIDRLIVNIKRNVRTEIIIINYHKPIFSEYKPLHINEL
jgi:anti-sigma regulatory factor (Ser/Thr protein kinase)